MNKQKAIEYLSNAGLKVEKGMIPRKEIHRAILVVAHASKKSPTLTINTKDLKASEIMDIANKADLDWLLSGNRLILKGNGSKEHNDAMVKIMETASDYSLAELVEASPNPKTPKGKKLHQQLRDGGFNVKGMGAEQYGTARYLYISFAGGNEERLRAEKFMRELGYKCKTDYWPGSGTAEVFIGSYNSKYDGHVEAEIFDIKAELTSIVDDEIKMTEESDFDYEGKYERIKRMKEIRAKILGTNFDSYNTYSKLHKELRSLFMDTSPRERIFLAFEKFEDFTDS
jgi:hypothetical protein